jgi:MoxR-like ATPase
VLATQNPIEQEGTYPLPEAQLDRFMFMVQVDYPTLDEEREILRRTTGGDSTEPEKVLGVEELLEIQRIVRQIPAADHVLDYALALTRGTRVKSEAPLAFLRDWVTWGAGPRASQYLIIAAKAHAALASRDHTAIEDVKAVAHPVLRHRILTNYAAVQEGMTSDVIVDRMLNEIDPSAAVGAGLPGVEKPR